jgi:hypothetical protein
MTSFFKLGMLALMLHGAAANAARIEGSSSGLSSPAYTESFNQPELPNFTPAGNTYVNLQFDQSVFVSTDYDANYGFDGLTLTNSSAYGAAIAPLSTLRTTMPVSGLAFGLITNPGQTRFSAYLGMQLVDSFVAPTSYDHDAYYYGFEGVLFDRVTIEVSGTSSAFVMDNLQLQPIAAVPEPASGLMLAGGIGLLALRRRMQRTSGA